MKAKQASVYRYLRELLLYAVPISERLPKSLPMQTLGKRLINDIMDSLDYICIALQTEKGRPRLDVINSVIVRMTSVKTVFEVLEENRAVSHKQFAQYLDISNRIAVDLGRMQSANEIHKD